MTPPNARKSIIVAVLALGIAAVVFLLLRPTAAATHRQELKRVEVWIKRARDRPPPPGANPDVWSNLTVALQQALYNPMREPSTVPTAEIKKMADELDATQGKQLTTLEGSIAMMEHMERICPRAKGYSSFENARMWMADTMKTAPATK